MNEQAPPVIADEVVIAAIEAVLKPLGSALRHYMPSAKAVAVVAMRAVLMAHGEHVAAAKHERIATLVEEFIGGIDGIQASTDEVEIVKDSLLNVLRSLAAAIRRGRP